MSADGRQLNDIKHIGFSESRHPTGESAYESESRKF
jgi:hypothetical protein